MPASKLRPHIAYGDIALLLGDPTPLVIALRGKKIKCLGCGEFYPPHRMHVETCMICNTSKEFCNACGGAPRAAKSIMYHASWYSNIRGIEYDGGIHAPTWKRYKKAKNRDAVVKPKLRVLNGGKRR